MRMLNERFLWNQVQELTEKVKDLEERFVKIETRRRGRPRTKNAEDDAK